MNIIQDIKEQAEQRMEICSACPFLNQDYSTCQQCGCFMKAKVLIPNAKCPLNKW